MKEGHTRTIILRLTQDEWIELTDQVGEIEPYVGAVALWERLSEIVDELNGDPYE